MTTIDQLGAAHESNGQYTTKTQSSPEVHLTPTNDGTFLFPPVAYGTNPDGNDLNEYVKFWTTAPISDGVLSNITSGYADLIRRQKIADGAVWAQGYDALHHKALHSNNETVKNAALADRAAAYAAFEEEWHKTRPAKIKAGTARSIARAGQLGYYGAALSDEDRVTVNQSTMLIGDEEITVFDIIGRYRLLEIRDNFQDPDSTAAERLEDLRQELRRMQQGN
jgi:hypothetical protein